MYATNAPGSCKQPLVNLIENVFIDFSKNALTLTVFYIVYY